MLRLEQQCSTLDTLPSPTAAKDALAALKIDFKACRAVIPWARASAMMPPVEVPAIMSSDW